MIYLILKMVFKNSKIKIKILTSYKDMMFFKLNKKKLI